ncbi:hypothetical protein PIB30_020525 [Stylosanthes scabra]|uniref:Uncharacterized protein n=1 Tax=Stylosanthes scabra TaxID=79078 RepID=A0ABU6Y939_9FABA|nr:hypothetical protein [Stylosanthes scabra]
MCLMWRLTLEGEIVEVQVSIYEKHQKSSRQGGSSGESHGLCGGVMDEYSKCGEGARGDVLNVARLTLEGEIVEVQVIQKLRDRMLCCRPSCVGGPNHSLVMVEKLKDSGVNGQNP